MVMVSFVIQAYEIPCQGLGNAVNTTLSSFEGQQASRAATIAGPSPWCVCVCVLCVSLCVCAGKRGRRRAGTVYSPCVGFRTSRRLVAYGL
jgi:hypothetical protein